jgi:uncharacterized protein
MKRLRFSIILLALALLVQPAWAEKRIALVIGNGAYKEGRLKNPANDAKLISSTLKGLGFEVMESIDLTGIEMKRSISAFGRKLERAGEDAVGMFFYAGHGVQAKGRNYLLPTDAQLDRESDLDIYAVNANWVLGQMEEAGNAVNLVVLDACRNNPFSRSWKRSVSSGLAKMEAPRGTMIAYATRPGNAAADGSGANSPYTTALASAMKIPGLTLSDVFIETRNAVMKATNDEQVPWEEGGLTSRFYFSGKDVNANVQIAAAPNLSSVKTEKDLYLGDFQKGLIAFNNGQYLAAIKEWTPLGHAGDPSAQYNLGQMSYRGLGVPQEFNTAIKWFNKAAEQAHKEAQFNLGVMNEFGHGTPPDAKAAFKWYLLSAQQGLSNAQKNVGNLYEHGIGVSKDYQKAIKWYKLAAEQRHPEATLNLGILYANGKGVPLDNKKAFVWFKLAAELGDADAQYNLGVMYRDGTGVTQDSKQSLKWYKLSAEQGNAKAQNELGVMYLKGEHIQRDFIKSIKWLKLGAGNRYPLAQFHLGLMYRGGLGTSKDNAMAFKWWFLADYLGLKKARKYRDELEESMTVEQVKLALNMAQDWLDNHSQ